MPQQTPLRTGDPRRVGRYRLAGRIVGIPADDPIYLGISPDGAEVAISMLRTDWAQDAAARDRFAAEAAVAKRVPPFCAARVLDAGLEGYQAYLVSEYVPGLSLLDIVAADGVRTGAELEAVAIGMATGLASVHQAGLVHGNFGPEYVIMAADGAPRVVEFGITPPYGTATPAADILAWAQTVVFAATGRPPASHSDLAVLPGQLGAVAARCLDPDPAERPAARSVVLNLLGNVELPAGVLAEGMRRATRSANEYQPAARPRHSAAAAGSPRLASSRPADPRSGPARPVSAPPESPRPPSGRPSSARPPSGRPAAAHQGSGRPVTAGTAQHHHAPQRDTRGRRTGLLTSAAVVVVVVIGVTVFRLLQGGGPNGRATTDGAGASQRPTASASASAPATPTANPTVPHAFTGTWSGVVRQPPTDAYHVSVTLKAGSAHGTVSYSGTGFGCTGVLSLGHATAAKLTMSQSITTGTCENGTVTISATGPGSVWFSFRSAGPVAAGKLNRG